MVYLKLYLIFFKIAALSFGGAWSAWAMIGRDLVPLCASHDVLHLCAEEFRRILAFGEFLPGPQVNAIAMTAFSDLGIPGMLVVALALVTPGLILIPLLMQLSQKLARFTFVGGFLTGARIIALAMLLLFLLNLSATLLSRAAMFWPVVLVHIGTAFYLARYRGVHPLLLVAGGGVAGFFLF